MNYKTPPPGKKKTLDILIATKKYLTARRLVTKDAAEIKKIDKELEEVEMHIQELYVEPKTTKTKKKK
jgi:hypothetical protein